MRLRPILTALLLVLLLIPASAFAGGGYVLGDVYVDDYPVVGLCVDIFGGYGPDVVASGKTGGDGDYAVYVAKPGTYTVRFSDCGAGYVSTQWYSRSATQDAATAVEVVSDQTTYTVNGYLSSAGRITGKVKDDLNAVISGGCVRAEDLQGNPVAQTTTDGNGEYVLGGVAPGDVRIRFEGCAAGNYVTEYYDDAASPGAGKTVSVASGQTTGGVDAVLARAGTISGHARNKAGDPVGSICVSATVGAFELASTITGSDGAYTLRGVPSSGSYTITGSDCSGTDTYLDTQRTGSVVAPPGTTTVDLAMARPASIGGYVTGDGSPLPSICVTARDTATGAELHAYTASGGSYELNRIRPGAYDLTFSDCKATGDWAPATKSGVVVGDGQTLLGVDQVLAHQPPPAVPDGPSPNDGDGSTQGSGTGGWAQGDGSGSGRPGQGQGGDHAPPPPPAGCKVPKLVGRSLAKARKALVKAHCGVGRIVKRKARSPKQKRGTVIAQRVRAKARKPSGAKVALTVVR